MVAGRPQRADPGSLYAFAHQFYWDFRRLAEGSVRWRFDEDKHKRLVEEVESTQFVADEEDRARYGGIVDREIQAGQLDPARREERLQEIEQAELSCRRDMFLRLAGEDCQKEIRIPGEPDVLRELLDAETPEQVCEICKDAFTSRVVEVRPGVTEKIWGFRNWPIVAGSSLPWYLSQYAEEFVEAKADPRYPYSNRPSNQWKQLWFLSRALAGAVFDVKTRTAINLVGSLRPEQTFEESRGAKRIRKQKRIRTKS